MGEGAIQDPQVFTINIEDYNYYPTKLIPNTNLCEQVAETEFGNRAIAGSYGFSPRGGSIRPKPDGRINKNQTAEKIQKLKGRK